LKAVRHYRKLDGGRVSCFTCGHRCVISEGRRGVCGVMENSGGILFSLVYGKAAAMHADPIEKKPFFHFRPGATAFSVATVGCNMRCLNCQNSDISQMSKNQGRIEGVEMTPEAVVAAAVESGAKIISYTYTEPAVFFDYALDIAAIAVRKGIENTFVTNGYFTEETVRAAAPLVRAANVDLKAFRDGTYRKVCGATLQPVLDSIRLMKTLGVWVEITTLLIPDMNDSDEELGDIARFVHSVDPGIPWHVSRFYPQYRMTDRGATTVESIRRARTIGLEAGLRYVYAGNVPGDEGERTFCWKCGAPLIERYGFQVVSNRMHGGCCPDCGAVIDGIW
jgi:pyruvate formate lyase activating enzyme